MACFKDFSQPINCSLRKNPNKTNHREFKHLPRKANGLPWGDQAVVLDDYCRSLPTECFSSLALLQYHKLTGFNILLSILLLLIKLLLYFFPVLFLFSLLIWRQSTFHAQWMSRSIPGNPPPLTMGSTYSLP